MRHRQDFVPHFLWCLQLFYFMHWLRRQNWPFWLCPDFLLSADKCFIFIVNKSATREESKRNYEYSNENFEFMSMATSGKAKDQRQKNLLLIAQWNHMTEMFGAWRTKLINWNGIKKLKVKCGKYNWKIKVEMNIVS